MSNIGYVGYLRKINLIMKGKNAPMLLGCALLTKPKFSMRSYKGTRKVLTELLFSGSSISLVRSDHYERHGKLGSIQTQIVKYQ